MLDCIKRMMIMNENLVSLPIMAEIMGSYSCMERACLKFANEVLSYVLYA